MSHTPDTSAMRPLIDGKDTDNTIPEFGVVPRCISWVVGGEMYGHLVIGPKKNPLHWWVLGENWTAINTRNAGPTD